MFLEGQGPLVVRLRRQGFEKTTQRDLGINNYVSLSRELYNHVRAEATAFCIRSFLFPKITIAAHAGQFSSLAQRYLAPSPAHVRRLESTDEFCCLPLEDALRLRHRSQLLTDCADLLQPFFFQF